MNYPLLTPDASFDAVILGNGDFPKHALALQLLARAPYICCCDGAATHAIEQGYMPHAIVGDGDSLPQELKIKYRDILHIVSEQSDNDLTKATRHCHALGMRRILYLGVTGKREDHTLANVSLMVHYHRDMGIVPLLLTDYGYFVTAEGSHTFGSFCRQQVSIFNFGCTQMAGSGLKWAPVTPESWWQGTLNEAIGSTFSLQGNGLYMVFRTLEPKK